MRLIKGAFVGKKGKFDVIKMHGTTIKMITNINQSTDLLPGLYHDAKTKTRSFRYPHLFIYGLFTNTVNNYTG